VSGILDRVGAFFFETAESPRRPPAQAPPPDAESARAVVLGAARHVVPVAAACAGELRARSKATAALLCIWRPADAPAEPPAAEPDTIEAPPARSPAGATTPGARRLAARLVARDLTATACGRLAWLALDPDPAAAARQFLRCAGSAGTPLVLAVAGPRPEPFEPVLAEADLCLAVLPADVVPVLQELALARIPTRNQLVVPPLPAGPPRWAAMAGLARVRSLPRAA
jgi:hypothetical protein